MTAQTIYLIGAYGYTAKLIAQELSAAHISFVPVGRDAQKLADFCTEFQLAQQYIVADVLLKSNLNFLRPKDIVINCAGPFNQFAPVLIATCVEVGVHYIDLTGEQLIVQESYARYKESAQNKQICLLHSMAFESALADLLLSCALVALEGEAVESVNSYYWLNSQQMSPGTKLTMKLANYAANYIISDKQLVAFEQQKAAPLVGIPYDAARIVPYPEVIFAFERCKPVSGSSHFLMDTNSNLAFAGVMGKGTQVADQQQSEKIIDRFKQITHAGPSAMERAQQHFELFVSVCTQSHRYIGKLKGADMYQITAELVLLAIRQLALPQEEYGVLSPGEFLAQNGILWLSNNLYFQFEQDKIAR